MATIKLPFFRGLVPRTGEQHMEQGQAVKAVNTDLDSGELRPLITPHREKIFPRAGEPGFLAPVPVDPSDPLPVDPTDPGIPGVPVPPGCIPVTIVTGPADYRLTRIPEELTFTVSLNADATVPVVIRWYIDDVLIAGETGTTLTISPYDLQIEYNNGELVLSPNIPVITRLYGVIKVVAQNPCGIAEAFCTVSLADEYNCQSLRLEAIAQGLNPLNFSELAEISAVPANLGTAFGPGCTINPVYVGQPFVAGGSGRIQYATVGGLDFCADTPRYLVVVNNASNLDPYVFTAPTTGIVFVTLGRPTLDGGIGRISNQGATINYTNSSGIPTTASGSSWIQLNGFDSPLRLQMVKDSTIQTSLDISSLEPFDPAGLYLWRAMTYYTGLSFVHNPTVASPDRVDVTVIWGWDMSVTAPDGTTLASSGTTSKPVATTNLENSGGSATLSATNPFLGTTVSGGLGAPLPFIALDSVEANVSVEQLYAALRNNLQVAP